MSVLMKNEEMIAGVVPKEESVGVETGISGVTAYKYGIFVQLMLGDYSYSSSSNAWNTIGTLPENLRPKIAIYFMAYDNSITEETVAKLPIQMRIDTSGNIQWYSFTDKRACRPMVSIMYFVN